MTALAKTNTGGASACARGHSLITRWGQRRRPCPPCSLPAWSPSPQQTPRTDSSAAGTCFLHLLRPSHHASGQRTRREAPFPRGATRVRFTWAPNFTSPKYEKQRADGVQVGKGTVTYKLTHTHSAQTYMHTTHAHVHGHVCAHITHTTRVHMHRHMRAHITNMHMHTHKAAHAHLRYTWTHAHTTRHTFTSRW